MSRPNKRFRSCSIAEEDIYLTANLSTLLPPQSRRQSSSSAPKKMVSKQPLKLNLAPNAGFHSSSPHSSPNSSPRSDMTMSPRTENMNDCMPSTTQGMNVTMHVLQSMNRFMQRFCTSVEDFSLFTQNSDLMASLMTRFSEALVLFEQEYFAASADSLCSSPATPFSREGLERRDSIDSVFEDDLIVRCKEFPAKLQFFLDQVLIGVMQEHVDLMLLQQIPSGECCTAASSNASCCSTDASVSLLSAPSEQFPLSPTLSSASRDDGELTADDEEEYLTDLMEIFSEPWDAPLQG